RDAVAHTRMLARRAPLARARGLHRLGRDRHRLRAGAAISHRAPPTRHFRSSRCTGRPHWRITVVRGRAGVDPEKSMMSRVVRSGASLLVLGIGLAGLYGSSAPHCSGSEGDSSVCVRDAPTGGGGASTPGSGGGSAPTAPPAVIPNPVVAINDRGIGYVAYAENGNVTVRRFN